MTCETCIETYNVLVKAPDCAGCPMPAADRQRVINSARAVAASWEQWIASFDLADADHEGAWTALETGMAGLVAALGEIDKPAVRPEVAAIIDRELEEHGELRKELAKE